MHEATYKIGIDLGGTKIEGVALDAQGHECARLRIATEAAGGPAHIVARIAQVYRAMVAEIDGAPHTFGLGTPGALSRRTGLLKNSNTVCLNGQPLREMVESTTGHAVRIENDANCFAAAEATLGAGRGKAVVFGVILGTGCGGGIVINGQVHTGLQAIGGEWGHHVIDPAGPLCYCGHRGCAETFISGGGLESTFQSRFSRHMPANSLFMGFSKGLPEETEIVEAFFGNFGRAMANLIGILDPDIVVLGGGLSNEPSLYTRGVEEVRKRIFSDSLETPIVKNALGDSAGVFGAAMVGI
jgi:fructokinase